MHCCQINLASVALAVATIACLMEPALSCGGYFEVYSPSFKRTISSPNYPTGQYDRNSNCIWLFVATNFTELQVNVSFMSLETHADGSCKDYVKIKDSSSATAELATLCSTASLTNASHFVILTRYLWIQFRSDYQDQDAGFELTVTAANNTLANNVTSETLVKACSITRYSCPNKECIDTSGLCDNYNDCGCDSYGCDETKCWKFDLLESIGFNWGVGVGVGFFIGVFLLIVFGLYEMPQHRRPECLKRNHGLESPETSCLLACSQRCRRNKVDQRKPGDQFKSMMEKMSANRHPLRWETESDSSRGGSRRTSMSGGQGSSRRSSYQMSVSAAGYGNTLSPKDLPPRTPGPAAAAAAAGAPSPSGAAAAAAPSPRTAAAASSSSGAGHRPQQMQKQQQQQQHQNVTLAVPATTARL